MLEDMQGKTVTEEQQKLVGREFVHFKGGHYRLEGFAKDSETLEEMVVYRALYMHPRVGVGFPDEQSEEISRSENRKRVREGGLWVRPAKMFFETIERDGKRMKRFQLLEDRT